MDIVDTFNHLIPSDQLDESVTLNQNLECEASNEFGTGSKLEDSLKNMLSDKDPMFGCASTQFNLLENEDPAFHIAGSTSPRRDSESAGLSSELNVAETSQDKQITGKQKKHPNSLDYDHRSVKQPRMSKNTLIRGRPGRRRGKWLSKSFLIEKGVRGAQQKKELTLGGRINISDLDSGLWLNPTVELRRLTVTIGGFKIELLPGPSYTHSLDMGEPASFEDGFSYGGDIDMAILPEGAVCIQNPVQETPAPENASAVDVTEKSLSDDANLGLGPYVNPNDVQTSNGTIIETVSTQEMKPEDKKIPVKKKRPFHKGKDGVKHPLSIQKHIADEDKTDGKEKLQTAAKTPPKPKQGAALNKNKELGSSKTSHMDKEHKTTQDKPSKTREDLHKMKSMKDKQDASPLKRHVENTHSEPAAKVQKLHSGGEDKMKPKSPGTPSSAAKKVPVAANRAGDHQGAARQNNPHNISKAEHHHHHPGNSLKTQDGGQEKAKKPEKIFQKQKSRNSRSISLDEPELFVPDNAPPAKKETVEEQPADTESVWDGNNCCGLCKKHHNNMFMVGCGRCDDWFHGDCVGLDLAKVREMEEEDQMYVCLKCCEEESKKVDPEPSAEAKPEAHEVQDHKPPQKPRPGSSQSLASGGVRPVRKETERRQSADVKEAAHKTGSLSKHESKSKAVSLTSKKPVSVEAIRKSVRDSLREILTQRLKDSDLNIPEERASEVAKKTERELFQLYKDTDHKYKNKYRSLMFNLKDTKNNVLFKRVLNGEISPGNLIRMSPEELASKELAAWRQRENRHTIEMIEKEQREVERRPITKITHKGEIEIESQEPMKAPEPVELEPLPKVTEEVPEPPKALERKEENTKVEKDTTSQHKSHLFDLHCKICTGRMAPPVEEAQTKVAKVATTVVRRHSAKSEEGKSTPPPPVDDDLHLTVLKESFRNAKSGFEARSDHVAGRDEEAAFLSNLKSLWRGFIHMHSVAKLVTKAFPVSGILDNLSEDLPDSIQVGGRISPQTVWDYLEKIRATGTKEVCLVRFSPETEEDEISYTLLYAYFSSRRRFGVVSNNLRQVKDMYLIPLGATEKVPHQLVPFDGPGLESNRSNLLLGLIIRQRPKRDFLTVDVNESTRIVPETKPITVTTKVTRTTEEEEKLFLSSLTAPLKKEVEKPLDTNEDEPVADSSEEPAAAEEPGNQEAQKPLRFLPGVLVGWGGELPPLPDVGDKPATTGHDTPKTKPAPKTDASAGDSKGPTAGASSRFLIRKKETKSVRAEPEPPCPSNASASNTSSGKVSPVVVHHTSITLKDKPPDVSTEAFLVSMSAYPSGTETGGSASANKSSSGPLSESEKETSEGNSPLQSESQATADHTSSSKAPLSGILKKSSAYSSENEDKTMVLQKEKACLPDVSGPKPVPVSSSIKKDPLLPFHQGYLQLSQARHKLEEINQPTCKSFPSKEDPSPTHPGAAVSQNPNPPEVQGHQELSNTEASEPVSGSCNNLGATTSNTISNLNTEDQNVNMQGDQDGTSEALPPHPESLSEPTSHLSSGARDQKLLNERYTDPWERPRNTEDRDHYGRHSYHKDSYHEKKSRHHDREREKRYGDDDKHRERSRHHGHSEDRHGERRKERHHSNDYSGHHKDRHRHRRDSDYENGRRSSKDSYSS
ncbi:PHD finger protein 3 isoform X1 [Poecilia latipinna]|uniref:PHD finger protein 3 n=1 Tax=Poecilia latipinna TaxID=48699 RepID=A0A3B3UYQ6_9TELE|nr:PREDICTED: PHD finger protein 3-like isoform X1 [Poecilia latipinna]XP_014905076.1 PREDICTED: PHD finger protein 3-like isoform X1 [Poecilia latipinna]